MMKQKLVLTFFILMPYISWADLDLITWKGIYYQAKPIKKGISLKYCKEHTIGSFIHTIKDTNIRTSKNNLFSGL